MVDRDSPAYPRDNSRADRPTDARPDPGPLSKMVAEYFRDYREKLDTLFRINQKLDR